MYPEILLPPEQKQAWLKTRTGAIVGRKTARTFGWKVGDKVPIQSTIWHKTDGSRTWDFDIVGIFDGARRTPTPRRSSSATTTSTKCGSRPNLGQRARSAGTLVRVKDPAQAAEVAKRIDEEFENSPAETKTEPEGAFVQGWAKQIGDIATDHGLASSARCSSPSCWWPATPCPKSVRERTGELGVLKAIGFTNGQVLALVLPESCLLAVWAACSGWAWRWLLILARAIRPAACCRCSSSRRAIC